MATPNFMDMSIPELEAWHRQADAQVSAIRADMLKCHGVLTLMEHQEMRKKLDARGPSIPGINLAVDNSMTGNLSTADLEKIAADIAAELAKRSN